MNDKASRKSAKAAASRAGGRGGGAARGSRRAISPATPGKAAKPVLLTGGNPQIPKGDGDGPVQAYIAAMPGWKRDVGRRLDAIIERALPGVRKAVRWNSPFYATPEAGEGRGGGDRNPRASGVGTPSRGWFLGFHCMTKYIKVAFFNGASLRPLPPGPSKQKAVRYLDIYEHDTLDEAQFADWVQQASRLPGCGGS